MGIKGHEKRPLKISRDHGHIPKETGILKKKIRRILGEPGPEIGTI